MKHENRGVTRKQQGVLILVALAVLTLFAIRLKMVVDGVDDALFFSRWEERKATIDLVCDDTDRGVAVDQDWETYDYAGQLSAIIGAMDAYEGGYTALFDSDMEIISNRIVWDNEAPLEPMDHSDVLLMIANNERGETTFPYLSISGRMETAWLYFRWIPTGENRPTQLLVVDAMAYSVSNSAPISELVGWCVALLVVATLALTVVIIVITPHRARELGGSIE